MQNKEFTNYEIVIKKLEKYCSLSERCKFDVIKKLNALQIYKKQNEIIDHLIKNNFINEKRFTSLYSNGKFNAKNWGKVKITYNLHQKGIDSELIRSSINNISKKKYIDTIKNLIIKKSKLINEKNIFIKKTKIARYLYQKGYETELVWKLLNMNLKKVNDQ